ncbi:MAG: hypothetical protein RL589_791, partial [Actinomycetota bacterium]
ETVGAVAPTGGNTTPPDYSSHA